jgi:hypothetical protein
MRLNAQHYGEYCEGVKGSALFEMTCDSQAETIKTGAPCVAVNLFPKKPEGLLPWYQDYIEVKKEK